MRLTLGRGWSPAPSAMTNQGRQGPMSDRKRYPGFAPEHDVPIPYMQRIRDYYEALGYGAPYRWAHYDEVPFQPLQKPLSRCRVALITKIGRASCRERV